MSSAHRTSHRLAEFPAKEIGIKVVDEAKAFGEQGKDIVLGTGREHEIKNVRNRKMEKDKGLSR